MLQTFCAWAKDTIAALPPEIHAQLTLGVTSPNPAAILGFHTPVALGRITFWDSGDYVAEILAQESGRDLFEQIGACRSADALTARLRQFLSKLGAFPHPA